MSVLRKRRANKENTMQITDKHSRMKSAQRRRVKGGRRKECPRCREEATIKYLGKERPQKQKKMRYDWQNTSKPVSMVGR